MDLTVAILADAMAVLQMRRTDPLASRDSVNGFRNPRRLWLTSSLDPELTKSGLELGKKPDGVCGVQIAQGFTDGAIPHVGVKDCGVVSCLFGQT